MTQREKRLQHLEKIGISGKRRKKKRGVWYDTRKAARRKLYPANWKSEIVPHILVRDDYRCRTCGIKQYAVGAWDKAGVFTQWHQAESFTEGEEVAARLSEETGKRVVVVLLACAHLENPDPADVRDENLGMLCNYHHAHFDYKLRMKGFRQWYFEVQEAKRRAAWARREEDTRWDLF